jgi:FlaA1/EpsC-like NDP-sugar epimerase
LSGFEPDRDVQIAFTGLRPGEKMYEELNLNDENTLPTHHEKIKVFAGKTLPADEIAYYLRQLRNACGD